MHVVKGISRQVIVVQSPDPKLFDQAIFILKEDALSDGISDEALLKEAKALLNSERADYKHYKTREMLWAIAGAMIVGAMWLSTYLL